MINQPEHLNTQSSECGEEQPASNRIEIITDNDVETVSVSNMAVQQILELNTPDELLASNFFSSPRVIRPDTIANASDLLTNRDNIRMLSLVPEKTREMRDYYHSFSQQQLAHEVEQYFTHATNLAFARNKYPYNLPPDVQQYIVWMKDVNTPRRDAAKFITQCAQKITAPIDNLIIFERSLETSVTRVRGSFPTYRHVHVWWVEK